ncbi:SDR family oxidoreductase [Phycisphaeraceae bacterium D3-23]
MTSTAKHSTQRVLIVGATSGIARAVAHRLASRGYALVLAARDSEAIDRDAADLRVRHQVEVETRPFDALDFDSHAALADGLELCAAVVCHGVMLSNEVAAADIHDHRRMIDINYTSYASVLEVLATYFEEKGDGVIAAISSVAGDRGRPSNYCYGATKAAVSAYLSGLRGRLRPKGVAVLTIKPGPTDTPMTHGLKAKGPTATPEAVAKQIVKDIEKRRSIGYTPRKWWPIMTIIRAIPEWVFKRLSL